MKILMLGGTVFLGRAIVEAGVARGHTFTLFNRGQRNPGLFPELEQLRGNRDGDLEALRGRRWDAVIDPSGYFPRIVRASAELLADAVDHYTFISSVSVYGRFPTRGMDESAPLGTLDDPSIETITDNSYGPLKGLCEQAVQALYPGRALIIRPGLIVGPHDPTNRFTYWVDRVARGGEVLAPDAPEQDIQVIDVRDLAEWIVRLVEQKHIGVYNATGPAYHLTLRAMLETCKATTDSDAQWVWADQDFLATHGVAEWTGLPLWIRDAPNMVGFSAVNIDHALADGLTLRPLATTIADTLAWSQTLPADTTHKAGISVEREAELLKLWREQH